MADETLPVQAPASEAISEETGQFDARFLLWRMFCSENSIPVETLPSELEGDAREKWDKVKDQELHKPTEGQ